MARKALQRRDFRVASSRVLLALVIGGAGSAHAQSFDVIVRGGTVYDGSGGAGFVGDVAIKGDRIVYVGAHARGGAKRTVRADGMAVSPGFINMLAHPEESLFVDGRAQSDLRQGVTLEVMGEDSMGPLNDAMRRRMIQRQGDLRYNVDWSTLAQYMQELESRGIAPNIATYVGAGTVRTFVLDEGDVQPSAEQLSQMRNLVRQAMEEGALGVSTALIYSPNGYARTPELIALAREAGRCGGIYAAHIRSEGDRVVEAVGETVEIAKASGAPAEIYHLKLAGRRNWTKLDSVIAEVQAARAAGVRISADMYPYPAAATGLDAAMPPWAQDGGLEAWIARLKDPATRAKVIAEMRAANTGWENLYGLAGADGTLLLGFKTERLKPLIGKTLAEVARERGVTPEDAAVDLVIEDGSRVSVAYFLMSEDNIRRQVALPWVSFSSDEAAPSPTGVFLKTNYHPRAYGAFARLLAKYVRDEKAITLPDAIHRLSAMPAETLSLSNRGRLKPGYFADVVVFDPATIQDHATFADPHQFATGVRDVFVNGRLALVDGEPTGAPTGRFVRGRAWTGAKGGGCRASSNEWSWSR